MCATWSTWFLSNCWKAQSLARPPYYLDVYAPEEEAGEYHMIIHVVTIVLYVAHAIESKYEEIVKSDGRPITLVRTENGKIRLKPISALLISVHS